MLTTEQSLDYFAEMTTNHLDYVEALPEGHQDSIHKKVLYASILDSLSKAVYPRRSNRSRYVEFVRRFSDWAEADHVSILHLERFVELHPDPDLAELREWTRDRYLETLNESRYEETRGHGISIDSDPPFEEVRRYWPRGLDVEKTLSGLTLNHMQHVNLLYHARNALVHEFSVLGEGFEWRGDDSPYYQKITRLVTSESREIYEREYQYELVYPTDFYKVLCRTSFGNLMSYLKEHSIAPTTHFAVGTYWVPALR